MPRDLPLGNGRLLALFDSRYRLREFHFPQLGGENHLLGRPCRTGVRVDGITSWIGDEGWDLDLRYESGTLVTAVRAVHEGLGIRVDAQDTIDPQRGAMLRVFKITDMRADSRQVKLLAHHDFSMAEQDLGDTARVVHERGLTGVLHYKRRRNILIVGEGDVRGSVNARSSHGGRGAKAPFEDFGDPEVNFVAHGQVDSCMSLTPTPAGEVVLWMTTGASFQDAASLAQRVRDLEGRDAFVARSRTHFNAMSSTADGMLGVLPPHMAEAARRAILVIMTQVDSQGGILAANDSDILEFGRDHYSYVWPRDGALVAIALSEAGLLEATRSYLSWAAERLSDAGFVLQKYHADGAVASTWHPSIRDGKSILPIQEDETALWLYALGQYVHRHGDFNFAGGLKNSVERAAEFLMRHIDATTGLPLPSWDPWEERYGTHAYTVGAVYGGLCEAARLMETWGDETRVARLRNCAATMRESAIQWLYHHDLERFVRMGHRTHNGYWLDTTVDSAMSGLWLFGMFTADDPRIVRTMTAIESTLTVRTDVGGIARYEDDYYHQVVKGDPNIPGNPWIITTLWIARWRLLRGAAEDRAKAVDAIEWALKQATPSGILPEQLHPLTGAPLSVAPLTWSHAEVLLTTLALAAASR